MYPMGEGTQLCPFPATGNGHERVIEPKGDHFSGRILGMIPKVSHKSLFTLAVSVYGDGNFD